MGSRKITNKDRRKWTKVPIFNDEYYVIVVFGDVKTVALCLEAWHYPEDDVTVSSVGRSLDGKRGVCFYSLGCHPVIAMPHRPKSPDTWGTLAHEATHAMEHVLDSIGERTQNEILAHGVGAIVRIAGEWRPRK